MNTWIDSNQEEATTYSSERLGTYVTCHQGVSVRYFYAVTGGVVPDGHLCGAFPSDGQ
jgi:hypothetical protein